MKKSLSLLLAILFLAACNTIEKSREEILTASNERDIAMESIRDLNRNASGELERWSYYQSEIASAQASLPEMSKEEQAKLNQLLERFTNYSGSFSAFIQEVNGFAQPFDEQQKQLDSMKRALSGTEEFDGNVNRILADIKEANEATKEKVKVWEQQLVKLGQEIESNYKQIRALQGLPVD